MSEQKKKCFVITPIGEEGTATRRHIDGIIKAAIRPALEDKYEVSAAHEHTKTGSINNQVITAIYTADLVVANLTTLNPNVMYELAIRHALRKPVIMIMEKGDVKLPFDVINERTIFYINDSQGVLDLRDEIKRVESNIDYNNVSNPIYDALNSYLSDQNIIKILENRDDKEEADVLKVILDKMNNLEYSLGYNKYDKLIQGSKLRSWNMQKLEDYRNRFDNCLANPFVNERLLELSELKEEVESFYKNPRKKFSNNERLEYEFLVDKIESERKTDLKIMENSIVKLNGIEKSIE